VKERERFRLQSTAPIHTVVIHILQALPLAPLRIVSECRSTIGGPRSTFDVSAEGLLAFGRQKGDILIFRVLDHGDPLKICSVPPPKIQAPVRSVVLASESTHILATYGQGFIWRYEHVEKVEPEAEKEDAEAMECV